MLKISYENVTENVTDYFGCAKGAQIHNNFRREKEMKKKWNWYDAFEEKCAKYEQAHNCKVIRLNDGEGVITDNSSITIVK